jgi:hypothetical protein
MATLIYIMCAATSAACATLLLRSYYQTRVKLLFWSGLCFVGLGLSNVLLVVDLILLPEISFWLPRNLLTLSGVSVLLFGLIWEAR